MTQMTLSELSDRAEIADILFHFCQILDQRNWDAMDQIFHDDASVRYSYRDTVEPAMDWVARASGILDAFSGTFHQLGNMLIDIDGDTAWCETYVTATHRVPPTAPKEGFWGSKDEPYNGVAGARYIDRFERRDGKWKIVVHETIVDWRHDEPALHDHLLQAGRKEARE